MAKTCSICGKNYGLFDGAKLGVFIDDYVFNSSNCCDECGKALKHLADIKENLKKNPSYKIGPDQQPFVKYNYNTLKTALGNYVPGNDVLKDAVWDIINRTEIYVIGEHENIIKNHVHELTSVWNDFLNAHNDLTVIKDPSFGWVGYNNRCVYYGSVNPSAAKDLAQLANTQDGVMNVAEREYRITLAREFLSKERAVDILELPWERITMFKQSGDVQYVSNVSGDGGGSNPLGALAGGLLFGAAGAIVGNTFGTDMSIQTQTEKHDNRVVNVWYQDENGITKIQGFPFETWDMFMTVIPEKEETTLKLTGQSPDANTNNTESVSPVTQNNVSPVEMIKQYKELLDMGAITQEEFDAKKKQLLGL